MWTNLNQYFKSVGVAVKSVGVAVLFGLWASQPIFYSSWYLNVHKDRRTWLDADRRTWLDLLGYWCDLKYIYFI